MKKGAFLGKTHDGNHEKYEDLKSAIVKTLGEKVQYR